MSRLRSFVAVFLAAMLIVCQFTYSPKSVEARLECGASFPSAVSDRVFALTNAKRSDLGYRPLIRLQSLDGVGAQYTLDSADGWADPYWDLYPSGYSYRYYARYSYYYSNCNVETTAAQIVNYWSQSSTWSASILGPNLTHIGVGGALSGNYTDIAAYSATYPSVRPPTSSSVALTPTSGSSGKVVKVVGRGFPANTPVDIYWGPTNVRIGYTTTDINGNFSAAVTAPNSTLGAKSIIVRVRNTYVQRSATYTVTATSASVTTKVYPGTAAESSVVTVSGTGYQPGEKVDIRFRGPSGSLMGTVTARSDGSYSGRVTIPRGYTGLQSIYGIGRTSKRGAAGSVNVTPVVRTFTTSVSTAPAGSIVRFSGQGFNPYETVRITWNTYTGQLLGTVKADGTGRISGAITIPRIAAGSYKLVARGQSSTITMAVSIKVTAAATLRTASTAMPKIMVTGGDVTLGGAIEISGNGFKPGEKVTLTIGTSVLGETTASAEGTIKAKVTIPADLPFADQDQVLKATGAVSNATPETILKVSDPYIVDVTISPVSDAAGRTVIVSAEGFEPGEQVEVRVGRSDGKVIATGTASGDGRISIEVQLPQGDEALTLVVVGDKGHPLGQAVARVENVVASPGVEPTAPATPAAIESPGTPGAIETPTEVVTPGDGETPSTPEVTPDPAATPTEAVTPVPMEEITPEPTVTAMGTVIVHRQEGVGARYELIDGSGVVIASDDDSDGVIRFEQVTVGSYILREVGTPAGYERAADQAVTVYAGETIVTTYGAAIPTPVPAVEPTPMPTDIPVPTATEEATETPVEVPAAGPPTEPAEEPAA